MSSSSFAGLVILVILCCCRPAQQVLYLLIREETLSELVKHVISPIGLKQAKAHDNRT